MVESIGTAIASVRTASAIVRGLIAASGSVEKAELKLKIADVAGALADARLALLESRDEIERLNARIRELETANAVKAQTVEKNGVYWLADGDTQRGPYCPACYEANGKLIPLTELPLGSMRKFGKYMCPNQHGPLGR